MCDLKPLYVGEEGYVAYCRHCGYHHVCFGTMLMNLSPMGLGIFTEKLKNMEGESYEVFGYDLKNIVIPIPASGAYMVLTQKEAKRLLAILEEADSEMKAIQLLDLFK
ncbi:MULTISPECIES: DUF6686 family protein [Chitinophagaceae]